jgi:hypothetical protein
MKISHTEPPEVSESAKTLLLCAQLLLVVLAAWVIK